MYYFRCSAPLTTVAGLEALGITITDACTADATGGYLYQQTSAGTCPLLLQELILSLMPAVTRLLLTNDQC